MTTTTKQTFTNNVDNNDDIKLNHYEVEDGATPEEIEDLKKVKKINKEIDNALDEDDKQYLSDDEVKKILKESKGYLSDDEVKNILKKYSDGKDVNDLSLLELNEKITYLEYQNFDILRIINTLHDKQYGLFRKQSNRRKSLNVKNYFLPDKEFFLQDKEYKKINDDIKECANTISDLTYKKEENNILKSHFERILNIKMRTSVFNTEILKTDTRDVSNIRFGPTE